MARIPLPWPAVLLAALIITGCQEGPTDPTGRGPGGPNFLLVPANTFTQVSAGEDHSCALRDDGVVECWGNNAVGQAPATRVAPSGRFYTQVSASGHGANAFTSETSSCALRDDGVVECWGGNSSGEAPATRQAASGTFTQVSAGFDHSCALRSDGEVECWGTGVAATNKAAASGTFTQVSAVYSHNCALRSDGVVECWGDNTDGQAPPIVQPIGPGGSFTQVSVGVRHSCAMRSGGATHCWGANASGEGPASYGPPGGPILTQVSAGAFHSCWLRGDGVVECGGDNASGQAPATTAAATGTFTQVSAGYLHNCALRDDGMVECWGDNSSGQAPAIRKPSTTVHVFPKAEFSATPDPVTLGQSFTLMLFDVEIDAQGTFTFTYAFDCGDGAGYGAFGASNTTVCTATTVGTRTVKGTVRDEDGDETEETASLTVIYGFGGFVGSVDAPPIFNLAKAGSAVPAKFSLGGNQGLAILATGYPKSQPIGCDASAPADPIEETVTAGSSSLSYDASTGLYTYVWKTDKAWANTCRLLTVRLVDGTDHTALFKFSR